MATPPQAGRSDADLSGQRPRGGVLGRSGIHLAGGLVLVGLAGYTYIAVVGQLFGDPADAAALTALTSIYLLVNVLGPGAFIAVEHETGRAVSAARAAGSDWWVPARRTGMLAGALLGGVILLALVLWPLFLGRVLGDRLGLLVALLVAAAGFALMHWVRGVLSGQGRLTGYALSMYLEGLVRLVPILLLLVLAVRVPEAHGIAFALGSVVAGAALLPALRARSLQPRDQVGNSETGAATEAGVAGLARSIALLVAAAVCMQVIANIAPVVVSFRLESEPVTTGVFALAFVLARVPLFLFSPVPVLLVPALARAVTDGRTREARRILGRALAVVLALGGIGCILAATVGPVAVEALFNAPDRPSGVALGLLGLATVSMMVALTLQSALIALGRQRSVTVAWGWGTVAFLVLVILPLEPIHAALIAQLVAPLVVAGVEAAGLVSAFRCNGRAAV